MLTTIRPRALGCLLLAAAWSVSAPAALNPFQGRAAAQDPFDAGDEPVFDNAQVPGDPSDQGAQGVEGDQDMDDAAPSPGRRGATAKSRRQRGTAPAAKSARRSPAPASKSGDAARKGSAAPAGTSFAKDVAPILVANCVGCHTKGRPGLERGKLDLTTFENLMKGTADGEKVVEAGKPADSHLVKRIKGEEEPRMPQGGDGGLAPDAIATIERWVGAGARLDPGLDAKAAIASYAASLDDVARSKLAKLSPKDLEAKIESVGLERWKKANPNLKPEVVRGEHFVLFSTMPRDRASATVKAMDAQHANLRRLLGSGAVDWVEKVSLYVFDDRKDYVEFVRTVKQGEVDEDETGRGDLRTSEPYVVVADPHDSARDEPAARRRAPRRRGGERDAVGSKRTLVGVLTEHTAESTVLAQDKSPRWLATGIGLLMASQAERRPEYYWSLRRAALEKYQQGWPTRTNEVLGDGENATIDEFRCISLALVECMTSPQYRERFPAFAEGMSKGKEKLDDVLKDVFGATREDFFVSTGEWVAAAYGNNQ
jgi:hypothetical protein